MINKFNKHNRRKLEVQKNQLLQQKRQSTGNSKLDWHISSLELTHDLERILQSIGIESLGDLCNQDLFELLKVKDLHLLNLAYVSNALKKYELCFQHGELLDLSDFYYPETNDLLQKCDELNQKRVECYSSGDKKVEEMYYWELLEKLQEVSQIREERLKKEAWRRGY